MYFAKELRKSGIPVGVISCNWNGTTASAWLDKSILERDEVLHEYIDDFNTILADLDLKRFEVIQRLSRSYRFGKPTDEMLNYSKTTMVRTLHPLEMKKRLAELIENSSGNDVSNLIGMIENKVGGSVDFMEIFAPGPGYENEPGALFEYMVKEIIGYSIKGVIWYQGCSDQMHSSDYERLFTAVIQCWRNAWLEKNPSQKKLSFIFTQLAPFGMWMDQNGKQFPELRRQQEATSKKVEDTYMISTADIGNVFDIHPKNKHDIGERLSRMALKYVYKGTELEQKDLVADAPEAESLIIQDGTIIVRFLNGEGLYIKKMNFSSYNGFSIEDIPQNLCPPVVSGINSLEVLVDGKQLESEDLQCSVDDNCLKIWMKKGEVHNYLENITVKLACRDFYQVNLYNGGNLPVKPFVLSINKEF